MQLLDVPAHCVFASDRASEPLSIGERRRPAHDLCVNTGTAKHLFCRICGVRPFYVPRSNPDGFSVNVRCLDQSGIRSLEVLPFDGENWEANGATLAGLSKDG
jgi:hypothetical protein